MTKVYKILSRDDWRVAQETGLFAGSAADRRDGFIHLSAADQVAATAIRHFKGMADLLLLTLDARALGPALRWETSFGGAAFPHFYGPLNPHHVEAVRAVPLTADGEPILGPLDS